MFTTSTFSNLKSRTMRRGRARIILIRDMRSAYVWSENLTGREHYEDLGLDGWTPNQIEWENMDRSVGQWEDSVNTLMYLQILKSWVIF